MSKKTKKSAAITANSRVRKLAPPTASLSTRVQGIVTRAEAADALRRDPSGDALAKLLVDRGLAVPTDLTPSPRSERTAPLPDLFSVPQAPT